MEKYLHQCVDSVLAQDFKNFEIILVDDGSPDNCPQICDEYAAVDKRVKVIHKENGGLSDARNTGIKNAVGDYLMFLDSDDYWEDTIHLTAIASIISQHPGIDTVLFRCKMVFVEYNTFDDRNSKPPTTNSIKDNDLKLVKMVKLGTQSSTAYLRVVKRSLIQDNNIFFVKGLTGEDSEWFINLSLYVKSSYEYPKTFYIYRKNRKGSITFNINKKTFDDQLFIIDSWYDKISSGNYSNYLKLALLGFISYLYCVLLLKLPELQGNDYKYYFEKLKDRKFLLKHSLNIKSKVIYLIYYLIGFNNTIKVVKTVYSCINKFRML